MSYCIFIGWHEWWGCLAWSTVEGSPGENDNDVLENLDTGQSIENGAHNRIEQLMQEKMEYRLTLDSFPKQIKLRLKDYCTKYRPNAGELQHLKASSKFVFCAIAQTIVKLQKYIWIEQDSPVETI